MVATQRHRGPDGEGTYVDPEGRVALGHNRLSILDLSDAGRQPMADAQGRFRIVYNGEIYNYLELRKELEGGYPFSSQSDTEVLLAAYANWGAGCLDRLIGMFAFAVWDERDRVLFAARDRFGVKPFYYHTRPDGSLLFASEIKALWAGGAPARPDAAAWASYLSGGVYEQSGRTFWEGVESLPAGHTLTWRDGSTRTSCWYDLAARVGSATDPRPVADVEEEYLGLLTESVRLRFRSDVPVGICLSGGIDSSLLLALTRAVQGEGSEVKAFTFTTGDPRYDELPWVEAMLARTRHPLRVARLDARDVPDLAASVQASQDEPFGGFPTLAYARLMEEARGDGVVVLLDGQGLDEQWAGYDYYAAETPGTLQGATTPHLRPDCLTPDFLALRREACDDGGGFPDALRRAQYRDVRRTKIPRALRFNDRVSMRSSVELREPFMDHRLFESAFRQPSDRKIRGGVHKWLIRRLAARFAPEAVAGSPKRPIQTPQREWLRNELAAWADDMIEVALARHGDWLDSGAVRRAWREFRSGAGDNSFFVWQWVNLGLAETSRPRVPDTGAVLSV